MKTVNYLANLAQSTQRGPSQVILGDCDVNGINSQQMEFAGGQWVYDDFNLIGNPGSSSGGALAASTGRWASYVYQGGTVTDAQLEGGVISLQSDGDNEGYMLQSSAGSFRIVTTSTLALNQKLWFEARVACSTVTATKNDAFVGLAIPALSSGLPRAAYPITTTDDTMDATNGTFLGFQRKGTASPTDWSVTFNLAGGTVNYPTGLQTLVATALGAAMTASQYVKLGFLFDPNALPAQITVPTARQTAGNTRKKLIRFFVNGVELPTFLSSDDVQNATAGQAFPTGFMCPTIQIMNQTGSTPGSLLADWIYCGQMPNS